MARHSPFFEFARVPVVPGVRPIQQATKGGPIWPDFDVQVLPRHCRNGVPVDLLPDVPKALVETLPKAIWGGFLDLRFGHMLAEHVSRLPFALREWPDLPVLFTTAENVDMADIGTWVWDVFDWIGLAKSRVRLVKQPLLVGQLYGAGQDVMMVRIGPSQAYLDLLNGWTAGLAVEPRDLVYVSRQGLVATGKGGHAGEGYLVERLQAAGIAVLDPAQVPILDQLRSYAAARTLIFAEGSAVHGRQLLGEIAQDIHVLRRRNGHSIARAQISPRCKALHYHDVAGVGLPVFWKSGVRRSDVDLRLYDLDALWSAFDAVGVDLRTGWQDAAYKAAVLHDIEAWGAVRNPRRAVLADYCHRLDQVQMLPSSWQTYFKGANPRPQ